MQPGNDKKTTATASNDASAWWLALMIPATSGGEPVELDPATATGYKRVSALVAPMSLGTGQAHGGLDLLQATNADTALFAPAEVGWGEVTHLGLCATVDGPVVYYWQMQSQRVEAGQRVEIPPHTIRAPVALLTARQAELRAQQSQYLSFEAAVYLARQVRMAPWWSVTGIIRRYHLTTEPEQWTVGVAYQRRNAKGRPIAWRYARDVANWAEWNYAQADAVQRIDRRYKGSRAEGGQP